MIQDEGHPEMRRAQQELLQQLGRLIFPGGRRLEKHLLGQMFAVVRDHRQKWRLRGVDFPVMVALVVEQWGIVEWVRADLDIASIRVKVVNFVRDHPQVSMRQVMEAFRSAYPDLKPDEILEKQDAGVKANERADKRRSSFDTGGEKD